MRRKFLLGIAIAVSLLSGAAVQGKPFVIHRWHGYGFLPGYHQPPNNSVPVYASKKNPVHGDFSDAPQYWNGAAWYYYGRPHFDHGRWNGGGYGPCYTFTPIGPIWNCG
jgi:hypothetical protein